MQKGFVECRSAEGHTVLYLFHTLSSFPLFVLQSVCFIILFYPLFRSHLPISQSLSLSLSPLSLFLSLSLSFPLFLSSSAMFDRLCPASRRIRCSLAAELGEHPGGVSLQRFQLRSPDEDRAVSSVQDWGQEIEEGAVYSVCLRKVQIQQAANKGARLLGIDNRQLPPGHFISQFETCRIRTIRAGTLEKLVENLLLSFGDSESTYMSIFLATYRAFATLQDILEILLKRYEEWVNTERSNGLGDGTTRGKDIFRKAVTSIFVVWFDQYPEDFLSDLASLHLLLPFFTKISPGSEAERRAHSLLNSNAQLHLTQEVERGVSSSGVVFSLGEEDDVEVIAEDEKVEILTFSAESVAEQLTFMDSELFRRVIPHQCLGSVWSRRDQRGNSHLAPSVRATITQFNAVTSAVQETVLRPGDHSSGPRTSALLRARIIEQWIDIAQECRILKNFSSLRAILSTLQSNAIHRLKKSWGFVSREKILIFDELSEIFSDENNYFMSREILMKEGTSKFANMESCIKRSQKRSIKRLQSQKELGLMQGTVPYLGTFLTDLTMLDTALPDFVYGGLINFEKRRKEFEIIAQIRLLQSACNNYSLNPAPRFLAWFHRQEPLSESEGYALSCAAEPLVDSTPNTPGNKKSMVKRLSLLFAGSEISTMSPTAKTPSSEMEMLPCSPCSPADGALLLMRGTQGSMSGDLTDSMSMASSSSEPDEGTVGLPDLPQALHEMPPDDSSLTSLHSNDLTFGASTAFTPPSSSSSSMSSPRSSFNLPSNRLHQRSVSCSAVPRPVYNQQTDDSCIIRVSLETGSDGNLYRSLLLTSQDKTAAVIQKAMEKHNLSQEPVENFQLVQTISNERELVMPDKANVFYAMSTSANFDFVLRRKTAINSFVAGALSSQSSSSLPNMKSKALSLSKTTF